MKKYLLLFITFHFYSQTKITLKDSLDYTIIKNAHIYVNNSLKAISNNEGNFILSNLNNSDVVKVSHISFDEKKINYEQILNDSIIFLNKKTSVLKEVVLSKKNIYIENKDRRILKIKDGVSYPQNFQIGIYIENNLTNEKEFYIDQINLFTLDLKNKKLNKKNYAFKVNLWSVDSLLFPKNKILINDILVVNKNEKKIKIPLEENIVFPLNGIFIVIELFDDSFYLNNNFIKPKFETINNIKTHISKEVLRYKVDGIFSEWKEPLYSQYEKQTLKTGLKIFY